MDEIAKGLRSYYAALEQYGRDALSRFEQQLAALERAPDVHATCVEAVSKALDVEDPELKAGVVPLMGPESPLWQPKRKA